MDASTRYGDLTGRLRRISALDEVAGLLNWDQETQMPPRGGAQRAEHCAAVAAARHALAADPALGALADLVADEATRLDALRNAAEARRIHERAITTPAALAAELAGAAVEGQIAWEAAREANDPAGFTPALARLVDLKRAEADCLAAGRSRYDALLDEYEPGAGAAEIDAVFSRLRAGLVDLRARIAETLATPPKFAGRYPAEAQLALSRRLGDVFGYDWAAGRLDLAVHPSSSGSHGDVRITTRIAEDDPLGCLYTTIHELGHAVYEQGLDPELLLLPAGAHASMAVHESQSRLLENQIGRGRAFCDWLHLALAERFDMTGVESADDLYRAVNAVETGWIRTEADEVHYNLHVMMRFDLERALIAGDLAVADLEAAWNARFARDFGSAPPDARRGVLQDVHWSAGLFGYFPTYALGNIYAAELHAAMRSALPDLETDLRRGDLAAALAWLGGNVHRKGRLLAPRRLIAEACGHEPDEAALLAYLTQKYGALYDL